MLLRNGELVHPKCPPVLLKFCQEIAAGLTYLSGKQFVHRDLAARNILVSDKLTCKVHVCTYIGSLILYINKWCSYIVS